MAILNLGLTAEWFSQTCVGWCWWKGTLQLWPQLCSNKVQGWEFVNPASRSSSPVWPYSCADYLSIKRVFGLQWKPSWFVIEVYWRNSVKHEIIYSFVQSVVRFVVMQKETQPRSGAYVTPLLLLYFSFIYLGFLDAFSSVMSTSESQRVTLILVLFVSVPLPWFQQFSAGILRKCFMACYTQEYLCQYLNGADKSLSKMLHEQDWCI